MQQTLRLGQDRANSGGPAIRFRAEAR